MSPSPLNLHLTTTSNAPDAQLSPRCFTADRMSFATPISSSSGHGDANAPERSFVDAASTLVGSYIAFALDVDRIAAQYSQSDPELLAIDEFRTATARGRYVGLVIREKQTSSLEIDEKSCLAIYVLPVSQGAPGANVGWMPIEPTGLITPHAGQEALEPQVMFPWAGCTQLLTGGVWLSVEERRPSSLHFNLNVDDWLRVDDGLGTLSGYQGHPAEAIPVEAWGDIRCGNPSLTLNQFEQEVEELRARIFIID
ncbi:hypothetical protein PUNSTDRAFT_131040 [Punctularia strigosozonata HHB-11173 SS5]|uniref:uncharacterized protein n=1 Tax=Punctularia strigosozonata (strain HHB-11173) TaxID=741275 RepID=UPI000441711A|nr:uncharacterized protein PUNSTDRAFT_131040 [Punctularia strigosozonata HHB-11173 SS5]EIN12804.1 hypothetical protein PUNSTDRAFT_131040 [Punctularia strigosozonata HHB-11173 SS5]